jgi:hypothetical protein
VVLATVTGKRSLIEATGQVPGRRGGARSREPVDRPWQTCDSTSDGATTVPLRPTSSDPTSQLRVPGPSATPSDSYWSKIERDAPDYVARTLRIDDPILSGSLSEIETEALKIAYGRLRSILPNTRLILGADPGTFSGESMPVAVRLRVDALFLDTVARPRLFVEALALAPAGLELLVPEAAR